MSEIPKNNKSLLPSSIIISGAMIAIAVIFKWQPSRNTSNVSDQRVLSGLSSPLPTVNEAVTPSSGVTLPVVWGNLGQNLLLAGAINSDAFRAIYTDRGTFTEEDQRLLSGTTTEKLVITNENAAYLLNLFWALGLAQKNPILESGEMMDQRYGGKQNFASTAGWTLAVGKGTDHYSYHTFFNLNPEQQALVDKISRGIYRPCCGNSTHFPDCNHGMAMLGLLELMASQGASEQDMWKAALAVNSYWFPDQYQTIASYFKQKAVEWKDVNPQEVLGASYSSAQGFAKISAQVTQPIQRQGGGGCGVGGSEPAQAIPKQNGGCGV